MRSQVQILPAIHQSEIEEIEMCELERDISELDSLRTQLAKANERVAELEDKHLNLVLWHNLDPQQAKLYSDKYANKFAIEQKIEELDLILELAHSRKNGVTTIDITNRAHELSNQLLKEKE